MKILTALFLSLLTVLTCVGCGNENFNHKIILVTQSVDFKDNGFNYGLWTSVQHYALETEVETLANPKNLPFLDIVRMAVNKKPGLLFISSDDNINQELEVLVKQHPEISFVMLDKNSPFIQPNYKTFYIQTNEGAFLAGYVAATMSKTHKVGFIGGVESATIDRFKYGYLAGVAYAGREHGLKIETDTRMANSYVDPDKGEELSRAMFANGCDIIFTAAGETGMGAITEAVQENKYIIGVDVDQQELAPKNIICSTLSSYDVIISSVIDTYLKREKINNMVSTGLAIGATGLAFNDKLVPYNVNQAVRRLESKIKGGFAVPYSEQSYNEFLNNLQNEE